MIILAALASCGPAYADMLGGGPIHASGGTGLVVCRLFNFGFQPVSVTVRQIYDNAGNLNTLTADTCNVSLAATKSCSFYAPVLGNLAYSCRVAVSGNDTKVSGVIEVIDNTIKYQEPMTR
jgi:hypothetical protein